MKHSLISALKGTWYLGQRSFTGESWCFNGKRFLVRRIGGGGGDVEIEFDPIKYTIAKKWTQPQGVITHVWRIETGYNERLILLYPVDGQPSDTMYLSKDIAGSELLCRTFDMVCHCRRVPMERIPQDILRAWRLSHLRSDQLSALYDDFQSVEISDEHAGILAFLHAYKCYERLLRDKPRNVIVHLNEAFEMFLQVIELWLELETKNIIVNGIMPLQVERYHGDIKRLINSFK